MDNSDEGVAKFGRVWGMSKTYASAEDVMATINAQADEAIAAMERAQEYRRATDLIRCRGTREGVEVEVNAQGFLVGVEFTGSARTNAPRDLAQALMGAYGKALDQVLHRLVLETREAWGETETAEAVVEDLRERFSCRTVPGGQR